MSFSIGAPNPNTCEEVGQSGHEWPDDLRHLPEDLQEQVHVLALTRADPGRLVFWRKLEKFQSPKMMIGENAQA